MSTLDWDKLRVFHAVAQAGSFTKAGHDLSLSQSAISRQISDLEGRLKITLFHRHARGLILTEQGEVLHKAVREVYLKLKAAESQISETGHTPSGELRVTTTMSLGVTWLMPMLHEFREQYPLITLEVVLDDRELDLSMREADVALRLIPSRVETNLIRKHLMYIDLKLYAHKAYLEKVGRPKTLEDLSKHSLLAFPSDCPAPIEDVNWLLEAGQPAGEPRRAVLRANSFQALLAATSSGMGISSIPNYMAIPYDELEVVLPDVSIPRVEVFFVYTEELRDSAKVAAFHDFLMKKAALQHKA